MFFITKVCSAEEETPPEIYCTWGKSISLGMRSRDLPDGEPRGWRNTGVPCLTLIGFVMLQRCCYFILFFSNLRQDLPPAKKDSDSLYWDTQWSGTKATVSPRYTCACESHGPENAFDGLLWKTAESSWAGKGEDVPETPCSARK